MLHAGCSLCSSRVYQYKISCSNAHAQAVSTLSIIRGVRVDLVWIIA